MAYDQDQRDAPEIVVLAQESGTVKRGRKCTRCKRTMPPGTRFERHAYTVDGEFRCDVGCTRLGDEWECPLDRADGRRL